MELRIIRVWIKRDPPVPGLGGRTVDPLTPEPQNPGEQNCTYLHKFVLSRSVFRFLIRLHGDRIGVSTSRDKLPSEITECANTDNASLCAQQWSHSRQKWLFPELSPKVWDKSSPPAAICHPIEVSASGKKETARKKRNRTLVQDFGEGWGLILDWILLYHFFMLKDFTKTTHTFGWDHPTVKKTLATHGLLGFKPRDLKISSSSHDLKLSWLWNPGPQGLLLSIRAASFPLLIWRLSRPECGAVPRPRFTYKKLCFAFRKTGHTHCVWWQFINANSELLHRDPIRKPHSLWPGQRCVHTPIMFPCLTLAKHHWPWQKSKPARLYPREHWRWRAVWMVLHPCSTTWVCSTAHVMLTIRITRLNSRHKDALSMTQRNWQLISLCKNLSPPAMHCLLRWD